VTEIRVRLEAYRNRVCGEHLSKSLAARVAALVLFANDEVDP